MSTIRPSSARRASSGRMPASSTRASPTPPWPCSRSAFAAMEGAESARATATGMAAVTAALMGLGPRRRSCGGGSRPVRLLPLRGGGAAAALRRRLDAGRRPRSRRLARAVRPEPRSFSSKARPTPTLEVIDIAAVAEIAKRPARSSSWTTSSRPPLFQKPLQLGADCVTYSATKHNRRPGPLPWRRDPRVRGIHPDQRPHAAPADRPGHVPLQRLGVAEGAGDAAAARAPAGGDSGDPGGSAGRAAQGGEADFPRPRRPSAGRHHQEADDGALNPDCAGAGTAARPRPSASSTR